MEQTLVEQCATIVAAQARGQRMTLDEISHSIRTVFASLEQLKRENCQPHERNGQTPDGINDLAAFRRAPKQSIQRDRVICLECGKQFRLLANRHLALHQLTPREYKRKWHLGLTTSLSAHTLTARRRKLAKKMGMGKQLAQWRANRQQLTG